MKYNPSITEKKWQKTWADKKVFKAKIDYKKPLKISHTNLLLTIIQLLGFLICN